jgi:hypothetical protein
MQFSTVTLLMASLMAKGLMANPFAAAEADLVELKVEQREGGSVVQYGSKRSLAPRADCGGWFQPACPKKCKVTDINAPECDSKKNGGTNEVCNALVNDLYGNRETKLQDGVQQLCWKREDGSTGCCIKWTKAVKDLTKGDLIDRADKSMWTSYPRSLASCAQSIMLTSCSQVHMRRQWYFRKIQHRRNP